MSESFVVSHTTPVPVPLVPEVTLHSADEVIGLWEETERLAPPFWAFPWAGGQALARYVLDHPSTVDGHRVLDLASGSGLVAIAAALAGARSVTANDIDPLAAAAIAVNARINHVDIRVALGDLLDEDGEEFDVVLAGDVFYDRDMAARVEPFLLAAHRRGTLVLVGDPQRSFLPRDWTRVDAFPVPVPRDLEGVETRTTTVWRPAP